MSAFYNEFDPKAAAWLRWLIDEGLIPPGDVDERSIELVQPGDLAGYTHVHFFAGIGGWGYASLLAGWPADRPLWTGSCPCQPFSVAGKGLGADDPRHLWPHFFRLIRACRPPVVVGEQVAGAAGYGWFDGVATDLGSEGYASRAVDIPAAAVDSPQIRQRLYWVAVADARSGGPGRRSVQSRGNIGDGTEAGRNEGPGRTAGGDEGSSPVADSDGSGPHAAPHPGLHRREESGRARHVDPSGLHGSSPMAGPDRSGPPAHRGDVAEVGGLSEAQREPEHRPALSGQGHAGHEPDGAGRSQPDGPVAPTDERNGTFWSGADWILCHDGKARRVADARAPLLVAGLSGRVVAWRGFGNAIVPQLAAEVLATLKETT